MSLELYKVFKRKTPKVAVINESITYVEDAIPEFQKEILPLVSKSYEIGLEIEIEGVRGNNIPDYAVWSPRNDGSLRNNGLEYVSVPINGDRIHYALNWFFAKINKDHKFSPRTSIHVHLNVLDMTAQQVGGLLLAYSVVEKLLYKFVGKDRDKNNFCVPYYDSNFYGNITPWLHDIVSGNYENLRYSGLNIAAIKKFGSLEFRHLEGTSNKKKIVQWINFLFCLKKYAMEHQWKDIHSEIKRLNTTSSYQAFVTSIFGEHQYLLDLSSLQLDMEYPVSKLKIINTELLKLWTHVVTINQKETEWFKSIVKDIKKDKVKQPLDYLYILDELPPPPLARAERAPRVARREVLDVNVPEPINLADFDQEQYIQQMQLRDGLIQEAARLRQARLHARPGREPDPRREPDGGEF